MSEGHTARKRFGQNFLVDGNIIDRIIRAIAPQPEQSILEIGPGLGAMTRPLLASGARLCVLEIDRDLAARLQAEYSAEPRFALHCIDALKANLAELGLQAPQRVVGNLPYNISTPLLFHLFGFKGMISDMTFMLQSEVVDRLAAAPGSKTYGRLSVMAQYHCEVQRLFGVPASAFKPKPKVMSAIVQLQPKARAELDSAGEKRLESIVKAAFSARRKTLRNTLREHMSAQQIEAAGIDPGKRAEQLELAEFIALANNSAV